MKKTMAAVLSITLLGTVLAALDSAGERTPEKVDYLKMTKILRRVDPGISYPSLHELYRRMDTPKPFSRTCQAFYAAALRQPEVRIGSTGVLSRILLIANASLYADAEARARILRYAEDIRRAYDCSVIVETVEGGTAEDIKALIEGYYAAGLDGVVLFGRLPCAWFEVPNDHYWWNGGYGYADWTIDLFYMDMDGLWEDQDHNGKYDRHSSGSGDLEPELFVGRIDASAMSAYGNETDLFCAYMDKDHLYWTGEIRLPNYGLVYTDHDWATEDAGPFRHLYGARNYEDVRWLDSPQNEVTKTDYLTRRLPDIFYGFVQIWTHATYLYHDFYSGGACTEAEVRAGKPQALAYNIDGCHACDWAAGLGRAFLGGSYLFSGSASSLAVIGTTKVGGMLGFEEFYRSLGENSCLGRAFSDWFTSRLTSGQEMGYILGWHYGMTIVGDPLVTLVAVRGQDPASDGVEPPLDFFGFRQENRSLLQKEVLHVLAWKDNPQSPPGRTASYRLYEAAPTSLVPLADIRAGNFKYWHRNLENRPYRYALSAVDVQGRESRFTYATVK